MLIESEVLPRLIKANPDGNTQTARTAK